MSLDATLAAARFLADREHAVTPRTLFLFRFGARTRFRSRTTGQDRIKVGFPVGGNSVVTRQHEGGVNAA
jgi:hypothetical protein